jgi:uncharacterized protein
MKKLAVAVILSLLLLPLSAEAQQTKAAKARELLGLMRAGDMAMQMLDGTVTAMQDAMPGTPDDFWTTFRKQIKPEEFIDLIVPIYAENFDDADLDGLIQFYRSPVGKRLVEKQPAILQQSMAAGQKWGEQLAQRAIEQLQKSKSDG